MLHKNRHAVCACRFYFMILLFPDLCVILFLQVHLLLNDFYNEAAEEYQNGNCPTADDVGCQRIAAVDTIVLGEQGDYIPQEESSQQNGRTKLDRGAEPPRRHLEPFGVPVCLLYTSPSPRDA